MKANDMATDQTWRGSWSGSEIRQVKLTPQGLLQVMFSVVSAQSASGVDGYLTSVVLTLHTSAPPTCLDEQGRPLDLNELLGAIASGHAYIAGSPKLQHQVHIPACHDAATLSWRLISGSTLEVQGTHFRIALSDQSQFRESFNC